MNSEEEEILDYPREKQKSGKIYNKVNYLALLLFLYWFVAGLLHWPFRHFALLFGLILLLIITVLRFFSKSQKRGFQVAYFLGKIALLVAIYLRLAALEYDYYFIYAAFALFGAGIIMVYIKDSK